RSVRGAPREAERPLGAGTRALDAQQPLLGVDRVRGQVLGGLTGVTHPTSHPQALEDSRRRRRATDRAGLAVVTVRTVRGTHAGEAVTLHDTGGALALGGTDHVDLGTGLEHVGGDLLAERELGGVLGADLGHVAARRHAGLL